MATNHPIMNATSFYDKKTLEKSHSESSNFSSFENREDEYQIVSDDLTSSGDCRTSGESSDNRNDAAPSVRAGLQASAGIQ